MFFVCCFEARHTADFNQTPAPILAEMEEPGGEMTDSSSLCDRGVPLFDDPFFFSFEIAAHEFGMCLCCRRGLSCGCGILHVVNYSCSGCLEEEPLLGNPVTHAHDRRHRLL